MDNKFCYRKESLSITINFEYTWMCLYKKDSQCAWGTKYAKLNMPVFHTILRDCSYGNSISVVFSLNLEIYIISLRSYTQYFPASARFILASCYIGKFWEKPISKMGDINVKNNGSYE